MAFLVPTCYHRLQELQVDYKNNTLACDFTQLYIVFSFYLVWNNYLLIFEMFLLSLISAFMLRPTKNAVFDRHPYHRSIDGTARRKGTIKPKASIRYYNTEPTAGQRFGKNLNPEEAVGGRLPSTAEDDDLDQKHTLVVPLLK